MSAGIIAVAGSAAFAFWTSEAQSGTRRDCGHGVDGSSGRLDEPQCDASDFAVLGSTVNQEIAPGQAPVTASASIKMLNTSSSKDNCKFVTVPLKFSYTS